jgi:D-3-phosphoglycerate dehydrogenase
MILANKKKVVVRFNQWYDPAMAARFEREPDIELKTVERVGDPGPALAALTQAHAFQISSAKDELPKQWFVTDELLAKCPNLLCVSSNGAGYDTVDVTACTRAGVLVVNQAGGNAQSVAEHAIGLMLDVTRKISLNDRLLRTERGYTREDIMGNEMSGKTLGIVGIGHIGTRVTRLARAFDMEVLAVDPYLTEEEITRRGAKPVKFDELLARSDFLSLHCPRDKDTMKMMNAETFGRMKKGAVFVTTARGGIHDEAALLEALKSGHLYGAGLDVWDKEPPPLDHPLLKLPNVVATYHTAGVTWEARRNMATYAAEQIVGILKGGKPPRLINPAAWPAYSKRFEQVMGCSAQPEVTDPD